MMFRYLEMVMLGINYIIDFANRHGSIDLKGLFHRLGLLTLKDKLGLISLLGIKEVF